jgi:hypothetical protein
MRKLHVLLGNERRWSVARQVIDRRVHAGWSRARRKWPMRRIWLDRPYRQERIVRAAAVVIGFLLARPVRCFGRAYVVELELLQLDVFLRARLPAPFEHLEQRELLLEGAVRTLDVLLQRRPRRDHLDRNRRRMRRIAERNHAVRADRTIDRRRFVRGERYERQQQCDCPCKRSLAPSAIHFVFQIG